MHVEIRDIRKYFGPIKANDGISFIFETGRIYAILGENGAGKSTLMKILSGYQTPTAGQILIDGQPVSLNTPNQAIAHGIGMLYQDPLDFAPLSVLENYISGRHGGLLLQRSTMLNDFIHHAKELGFALNPHALVETLTVGERQQLEIVRLLSYDVRLLILDEPTTGISAEQKSQLFNTLKRLAEEQDLTIVLVSHKLEDVEELCEEVLVLRKGRLVGHQVLPTPTAELVEMMFGKRIGEPNPQRVETGQSVLNIEHLPVHARLFSIPEINLSVKQGEVIGLAGLDGSGQVDFMREVGGLNRPTWADHIFGLVALVFLWLVFNQILGEAPTVLNLARVTVLVLVLPPIFFTLWRFLKRQFDQNKHASRVELNGVAVGWRGYRDLQSRGVAYLSAGRIEEGLVSGLTVMEHVALALRNAVPWVNWWAIWQRTRRMIQDYNVIGRPLAPIQTLSGGNQQRVSVGLLPENLRVILLENPTRGLDVESARHIWHLLLQRREEGTCIIFYSPDLDEILDYSDRILVFSSGRATLVENPAEISSHQLGELIGGKQLQ